MSSTNHHRRASWTLAVNACIWTLCAAWCVAAGEPPARVPAGDALGGGFTLKHQSLDGAIGAAFSPDGSLLACSAGGNLVLWDPATRQLLARIEGTGRSTFTLAFSPDGKYVAGGGGNGNAHIWDVANRKLLHLLTAPEDSKIIRVMGFINDGKELLTTSNHIRIWDVTTGKLKTTFNRPDVYVNKAAMSPDGKWLAIQDSATVRAEMSLWSIPERRKVDSVPHAAEVGRGICIDGRSRFSPDSSKLIASQQRDRGLHFFRVPGGEYAGNFPYPVRLQAQDAQRTIIDFRMTPDNRLLVLAVREWLHGPDRILDRVGVGAVVVYDIAASRIVSQFGPFTRPAPGEVAVSPDGKYVVGLMTANGPRDPILWELKGKP